MEAPRYPFDVGFQTRIVALLLQDPAFLPSFRDIIRPAYFEALDLSVAVHVLVQYYDAYRRMPDRTTVLSEARGYAQSAAYTPEQTDALVQTIRGLYTVSVADADHVRDRIVQFGRRQAVKDGIYRCIEILRGNDDVEECRRVITDAVLAGYDVAKLGIDVHRALPELPAIIRSENQRRRRVPTGIPSFDRYTFGGPCRGHVWVVLGLIGGGKSVWLLNMAAAAIKQGIPVVHYTLGDLNEEDTLLRYGARFTGVPTWEVVKEDGGRFRSALGAWDLNPFYLRVKYYPSGRASVETLRAHLAMLRAVDGVEPGLVVVDYADELRELTACDDNSYQAGGSVFTQLQGIAQDFDCLVWTGCQIQRWRPTKGDEVIRLDKVGESLKKAAKADGVVSVNQTAEEYGKNLGRLWIDKARHGLKFKMVPLVVDYQCMWITEQLAATA